MEMIMTAVCAVLAACCVFMALAMRRNSASGVRTDGDVPSYDARFDRIEMEIKDGFERHRKAAGEAECAARREMDGLFRGFKGDVGKRLAEQGETLRSGLLSMQDGVGKGMDRHQQSLQDGIHKMQDGVVGNVSALMKTMDQRLAEQQKTMQDGIRNVQDGVVGSVATLTGNVNQRLAEQQKAMQDGIRAVQDKVDARLAELDRSVREGLKGMLEANERKLEQMRNTVDEKLQNTLETRLAGAFGQVSKQLESVEQGLGAMQTLAGDVGGLKRALSNVKVAGTMGEYQLEALLSQLLHPSQYEANVHPNPENRQRVVEFAIRLPGADDASSIWLPIDSKFPTANYDRLLDAYQAGDVNAMESARKELVKDIKRCAGDISGKYVEVPYTTPFALMFLPFEGLYAEVIRIPGLFAEIQRTLHVTIVGPTTLGAFLSSLQMGFRTLAVQKKTEETIKLLGAVRTQFGRFGTMLEKAQEQIGRAEKTIGELRHRNGIISRSIQGIEELPMDEAQRILPIGAADAGTGPAKDDA